MSKLEDLQKSLLYNSISDTWFAMCEDKGWSWYDLAALKRFVQFLKDHGIQIRMLPVCPTGSGDKAEFAKKISALLGDPNKSYVIRTDTKTIEKVRNFQK